jgi:hypothetical protein
VKRAVESLAIQQASSTQKLDREMGADVKIVWRGMCPRQIPSFTACARVSALFWNEEIQAHQDRLHPSFVPTPACSR